MIDCFIHQVTYACNLHLIEPIRRRHCSSLKLPSARCSLCTAWPWQGHKSLQTTCLYSSGLPGQIAAYRST